jgi:lysophospholipase L1-like esterase
MLLGVPKYLASIAIVLTTSPLILAQSPEKPFYLRDGDTVVFYGDSITEQRFYTADVDVYTVTRFPHMQVQFFNAGVGGDRVTGGSGGPVDVRLPRDVFAQKPTVVTVMLGMNDGGYGSLTPEIETKYTQGYEHILASLEQALPGVRISLLGPSPYDEVTRPEGFPGGYNSTLARFAEIDSELARKHNATFIDLNAPFVASLKRAFAINPLATELLLPDRVHPEPTAHWLMAAALLKGWNAPSIVSSTTIDAKQVTTIESRRSHVSDLAAKESGIAWTELDDALPLPLDHKNAGNHFLLQISDIEQDLDQQLLTVQGLSPGSYQLTIDGTPVSTFTDAELAKGVNLASFNTPMRGQAFRVSWLVRDRDEAHHVRLRMFANQIKTGVSAEPGASDLSRFEKESQSLIYEAAQPLPHHYQLKAITTQLTGDHGEASHPAP